MASSIGRAAIRRTGSALMAAARRSGCSIASLGSSSCSRAILMPSRPRRLLRWLLRLREPRGWRTSASTRSAGRSGSRSSQKVALPCAAICVAQPGRGGIDQAALHARGGGDELALAVQGAAPSSPRVMATDLNGWPAKRSRKCAVQPWPRARPRRSRSWTAASGATGTPRGRQPAPPRRRPSPAATSWRRPAPAAWRGRSPARPGGRVEQQCARPRPSPVQRWRM